MTVQNYIGLDARIEAIVRALMGDVDVDLSDFYTKEEVDALIASGGTGLQINYNDLLNRPIIDGLMQSNLDLNGHFLLYNSQRLYCPAVIENIITFDSDVSIPNMYNKAEVDALIAGGGEVDAYTKAETDGLLALKANVADVYSKAECDGKYFNKTQQGFNFYSDGTYDYNGGSADQECSVAYFGKTDIMKMRFCGGSRRCTFCTVGGVGRTDINLWSCTNWGWLAVGPNGNAFQPPYESGPAQAVLTVGPIRNGIDFRWKYEFDEEGAVTGGSPYLRIAGNEVWIPEKSVMQYRNDTDDVLFSKNAVIPNIYNKEEVDALIAGGGGGTCRYNGPENTGSTSHIGETWQLNFESNDNPAYVNALTFAQPDKSSFLSISCNHTQKSISFREGGISGGGVTIYPQKNELFVPGKVQASNIEAQTALLVNGPTTLNMRADVTDLNINGSNCNVYTKDEVDAKLTGSFGSKLSVNTYRQDSTVSGEFNGLLTVGGNQNKLTVTAGRTSGFAAVGGALNNCTFSDRTENAGMMFIGGVNCNSGLTGVKQGLLVVGGQGNNPVLQSDGDAMVMVGPSNGFQLFYRASGNTAVFMMNGKTVNVQYSQTITHEAPFTGDVSEYSIGDPVFASGRVCQWDGVKSEWTYETNAMDCICEVKPEGTVGEYVGICVAFVDDENHYAAEPSANTKSLIFATHGDYYFNVADSSKYKIGDIILLDGSVLKDDMALTGKVMKMIIGRVTAKINKYTVAVLKD